MQTPAESFIVRHPNILNGTPVFAGTRVPVATLFDHIQSGRSLTDFLLDFPAVSYQQAIEVLMKVGEELRSKKL